MKPSIQTLGQVLYSPSQYIIPVFQRNYRWEGPQWESLWESLEEIERPDKKGNHFMGFLVFIPELAQPGQHTKFHMIDGQQRLTTLCILLAAIRDVSYELGHDELAEEVDQYYLVHPLKKGEEHFRLLPKERDHDSYIAVVKRTHGVTGRLDQALRFFKERVSGRTGGEMSRIRSLFNTVTQRLEFMCATLETEDAYSIFKSLNSTGVPLDASDLIRNFIFMHVGPSGHDEFDREFWTPLESRFARGDGTLDEGQFSRFFRDFLMSSGRYIRPGETFSKFEARYEATNFDPQELGRTLLNASSDYAVIAGTQPDSDRTVMRTLTGLNAFESPTTYPLLLALFKLRREGKISSDDLAASAEMLQGFILRRSVCGESSRGYGQIFVRAISTLEENPLANLKSYLFDRGWPDNRRFTQVLLRFPLYQQRYAKHLLATLERSRGHKEAVDLSQTEIEHIMPQTLSAEWRGELGQEAERLHGEWLHTLGNLSLTGYNAQLSNDRFSVKRKRYAESNVILTRELAAWEHWNEDSIRTRAQALANEVIRLWPAPDEKNDRPTAPASGRYRPFFQLLVDEMREYHRFTSAEKAIEQSWYAFASGHSRITYNAAFAARRKEFTVELYIQTPDRARNKRVFDRLFAHKAEIEKELGHEIIWDRNDEGQFSRVLVARPGMIDDFKIQAALREWGADWVAKISTSLCAVPFDSSRCPMKLSSLRNSALPARFGAWDPALVGQEEMVFAQDVVEARPPSPNESRTSA